MMFVKRIFMLVLVPVVLLGAGTALAQYDIHLKSGSVIKKVARYERKDGMVVFKLAGGVVAVYEADVLRIVKSAVVPGAAYAPPPPPEPGAPAAAPPELKPVDTSSIERRVAEINRELRKIKAAEDELDALKKELEWVRLRVEILFQRGLAEAKKQGGKEADWFKFLKGKDRDFAQLNTLKKRKLLKEIPKLEAEYQPLLARKPGLLEEKERLEAELREASGHH